MGTRKCATYTLPFEYIRGLKSNSGKAGSGAYTHGLLGLLGFQAKSSSLPQPLAGACRAAQDGLRLANLGGPSRSLAGELLGEEGPGSCLDHLSRGSAPPEAP